MSSPVQDIASEVEQLLDDLPQGWLADATQLEEDLKRQTEMMEQKTATLRARKDKMNNMADKRRRCNLKNK